MDNDSNVDMVQFNVSRSLRKTTPLPDVSKWKVHHDDIIVSGKVVCYTKAKGMFFERLSSLAERAMTVTRHGYLIIYETSDKGFVLDIGSAIKMFTDTVKSRGKKKYQRRCHMKIKFVFGTVHVFVVDEQICAWRTALSAFFDRVPIKKICDQQKNKDTNEAETQTDIDVAASRSPSVTTCLAVDGVVVDSPPPSWMTSFDFSLAETFVPVKNTSNYQLRASTIVPLSTISEQTPQPEAVFDATTCDSSFQWLGPLDDVTDLGDLGDLRDRRLAIAPRAAPAEPSVSSNSGLFTEADDMTMTEEVKSVRCGYQSVANLRKVLELKMKNTLGKKKGKVVVESLDRKLIPACSASTKTNTLLSYFATAPRVSSAPAAPVKETSAQAVLPASRAIRSFSSPSLTSTVPPELPDCPPPSDVRASRYSIAGLSLSDDEVRDVVSELPKKEEFSRFRHFSFINPTVQKSPFN